MTLLEPPRIRTFDTARFVTPDDPAMDVEDEGPDGLEEATAAVLAEIAARVEATARPPVPGYATLGRSASQPGQTTDAGAAANASVAAESLDEFGAVTDTPGGSEAQTAGGSGQTWRTRPGPGRGGDARADQQRERRPTGGSPGSGTRGRAGESSGSRDSRGRERSRSAEPRELAARTPKPNIAAAREEKSPSQPEVDEFAAGLEDETDVGDTSASGGDAAGGDAEQQGGRSRRRRRRRRGTGGPAAGATELQDRSRQVAAGDASADSAQSSGPPPTDSDRSELTASSDREEGTDSGVAGSRRRRTRRRGRRRGTDAAAGGESGSGPADG